MVFQHIQQDAHGHFQLHFYAAVYHLIYMIHRNSDEQRRQLDVIFETYPFLAQYFREMLAFIPDALDWEETVNWWQEQITQWESNVSSLLPIRALVDAHTMTFRQRMLLILANLSEVDSRFGTLYAALQAPLKARRPTLELLANIVGIREGYEAWTLASSLMWAGLLVADATDAPRPEWILAVPGMLWDALRGAPLDEIVSISQCEVVDPPGDSTLVFDDDFIAQVQRVPALLMDGQARLLILRGAEGSDRLLVLSHIAHSLGCRAMLIRPDDPQFRTLLALAVVTRSLPIVKIDAAPGEVAPLPDLPAYHAPFAIMMGPDGGLPGETMAESIQLRLPDLSPQQRFQRWLAALGDCPIEDAGLISQRFRLGGEYIRQAAEIARTDARLQNSFPITIDHVRRACHHLNQQQLSTLAEHIDSQGSWDDLVVSSSTGDKLHELHMRCRQREALQAHLAPVYDLRRNVGVRALFTGSSGTGKTLAASILAAELGMDLYRMDLAAVINKYVGETEKNLNLILSRAEQLDVILLLDEGDALLGNRTELRSANDRYANLETNFLLQRLESYQGIVIITTNAEDLIDPAFQRRMDVVAKFSWPDAGERHRIWRLHLPPNHQIDAGHLENVASRCRFSGGQIRNAALYATLLAVERQRPLNDADLDAAVQAEYRKAGSLSPLNQRANGKRDHGGMHAFLRTLS